MEYYPNPVMSQITRDHGMGAQLFAMAIEQADGADVRWIRHHVAIAQTPDRRVMIDGSICNESLLGARIVNDKLLAKHFLQEAGVATAAGALAESADHAVDLAAELGGRVVIKPASSTQGKGVSVDVATEHEIREAYDRARAINATVLVETYIDIEEEYRCIATPRECVSVVKRVLPFVVGDGVSTISELVRAKNEARKVNPALRGRPIPIDAPLEATLARQELAPSDVLAAGRRVTVRNVNGLSNGGEPHEYSGVVDDALKAAAVHAIAAIPGLEWGGVDLAVERGTGDPYVIEINCSSDYGGATFPLAGEPQDVAGTAWRLRKELGGADVTGEPLLPAPLAPPITLDQALPGVWARRESLRLSALLLRTLRRRGYRTERAGSRVLRLIPPEGDERWLTDDLGTELDLLAARRMLRRHETVHQLLEAADVPRVTGRRVTSAAQLARWQRLHRGPLAATRPDRAWTSRFSRIIDPSQGAGLFEDHHLWYVQPYRPGTRVRVFAATTHVLAVTTAAGSPPLDDDVLRSAGSLAVAAVRAVPELRWGVVDVLLSARAGRRRPAVVEGMLANPPLRRDDLLLAGDPTTLLDEIFGERP